MKKSVKTHSGKGPKVSVIVPTYNGKSTILPTIRSVLLQSYRDFELIIIDDGSTDGVGRLVKKINDPRIRYIRHKKNLGVSKARNRGLKLAKGKYMAYCDHDDIWYKNHLKEMVSILDKRPDVGLVYAKYRICGKIFENPKWSAVQPPKVQPSDRFSKELFETKNIVGSPLNIVHRKLCIDKVGGFDESRTINIHSAEDWDLWLRISDFFKFYRINKILAKFTYHGKNRTKFVDYSKSILYVMKKRAKRYRTMGRTDYPALLVIVNITGTLFLSSAADINKIRDKLTNFLEGKWKKLSIQYCNALELCRKRDFLKAGPIAKECILYCKKSNYPDKKVIKSALIVLMYITAKCEFQRYNYKEVIKICNDILKMNKHDIMAKEQLAIVYFKLKKYKKALKISLKYFSAYFSYNLKGVYFLKRKLYSQAISSFKKALRCDRKFLPAKKNLEIAKKLFLNANKL